MKCFANTIVRHVIDKCKESDGLTLRFILPSYPADLLFEIGKGVEEGILRITEKKIRFQYGIAYGLGQRWENGTQLEKDIFNEIRVRGWYNETDNLTSLRHLSKAPDEDCLLVLLAGYEDIRDQSSLEDFFHLNQKAVWEICLERSFKGWVENVLKEYVNPDGNEQGIEDIANLFSELYQAGLADPIAISSYLDEKDFSIALDGRDAFKAVLEDLDQFGLPNMIGFEKISKRNFMDYVVEARKFFTYNRFLDAGARKKAEKIVDKFTVEGEEELPAHALGGFSDKAELVDSLKRYIKTGCQIERDKLTKADFICINDKILGYKGPKTKQTTPKDTVTSVTGHALEVFLYALWQSIADFKKNNKKILAREDIQRITLTGLEFRHQFESGADEDARKFLQRLIGGVDQCLKKHILIGPKDREAIVESNLAPKEGQLKYSSAGRIEPRFIFQVEIDGKSGHGIKRKFAWLMGENSQPRFLVGLYNWVIKEYEKKETQNIFLPAFAAQHVNEMFMAKDAEDVIRIFNQGMEKGSLSVHDLIIISGPDHDDCLIKHVSRLSRCFQAFLGEYAREGFFSALETKFNDLRRAYRDLLQEYLKRSSESTLGSKLMKAFMLLPQEYTEAVNWQSRRHLDFGVITALHPALLQMIHHQHTYLCNSFCSRVNKGLGEVGTRGLSLRHWHRLLDLSQIKWPILGILDEQNNLNTNVHSYDHIHLVGAPKKEYSSISSKLLIKYEDSEDDITGDELFRETQEGKLIKRILLDYCKLHPYANDGISIGAYCGGPIQHLIGGIDAFLAETVGTREGNAYSLNLVLFSDSPDDMELLRWVNAWKERWQLAGESTRQRYYANSEISVYYRVIPQNDLEQLKQQILQTDLDILFFTNFTSPQMNDFLPIGDSRLFPACSEDYLKFPILEKVGCVVRGDGTETERKLVISNRQFQLGTLHAEVMARLKTPSYSLEDKQHVVVSTSEFQPWVGVLDVAHAKCVWVVCIDPIVDEKLIRSGSSDREIIGFGTGVGPHGEFNFTISTEQFYLSDIIGKISDQLTRLIGHYDDTVCMDLAKNLIKETSFMPGLSLVKATGQDSEYIRDFIAYALVRKLLPKQEGMFCDEIISLDAFLHWFDFDPRDIRPDLLRLQARNEDGLFKIKIQVIECKLAQESERYLEDALRQVQVGLQHLVSKFRPRQSKEPIGVEVDGETPLLPDQRYWWLQLHRLISGRGEITKGQERETVQALEFLSDGYYTIEWEAACVVFWTDVMHGEVDRRIQGSFAIDDQEMNIYSIQCGREFICQVGLEKRQYNLFSDEPTLRYYPLELPQVEQREPSVDTDPELEKQTQTTPVDLGKEVAEIEIVSDDPDSMQVSTKGIPKRILLGSGTSGGRDVYWEFGHPELPNRHLLIFGASGTGKTYTIQAIMAELSKFGINSLIVDYSSGFTNKQLEPAIVERLAPTQHVVRQEPLPINPFRKQCDYVDEIPLYDTSANIAQRVTGVFSEVFTLGEQQKAVLYEAIQSGVEDVGSQFNLQMLMSRIEAVKQEGGVTAIPATTVANKMRPFVDMNPFGEEEPESWERLFLDPVSNCHILQLAGFMKDSGRLITEFSLIDLYWFYKTRGTKDKPRVIVLDEIQNLDHRLESPLGQFLTEGRKFGISLILATQTLSNFTKDEKGRLFQASHKLFFKPADTEIKTFAQLLADATNESQDIWIQRLSVLKRGECYSLGIRITRVLISSMLIKRLK